MKKYIISILALCAIATAAAAQIPIQDNLAGKHVVVTGFPEDNQVKNYDLYEFNGLLERENSLLGQRRIATIISLSGSVVTSVGLSLRDQNNRITQTGTVISSVGLLATLGSGVWLIVNEFQLISTRRKINEKTQLRVTPTGVSLHF